MAEDARSSLVEFRDSESQAERYNHGRGSCNATIDAFAIPGEPEASMIVRRICRTRTVWPEQVFGYERARALSAAVASDIVPLSSGRCSSPDRRGYVVLARRLMWRGIYGCTDLSVENIAELFGYSPASVRPWATSWRPFEKSEGAVWWHFWGPALADDVGVPLDEYDPVAEAEAVTNEVAR